MTNATTGKGWDVSGSNAELIAEARQDVAYAAYHDDYPAETVGALIDALDAAEARADAALAVITEAHNLYGNTNGTGEQLAWAMWEVLEAGQIAATS